MSSPTDAADATAPASLAHRLTPMRGRDPHESGRASTPLELLFDLTFAVSFGKAGEQMAHAIAAGHLSVALIGFGIAMFAIIWAWINFSWFASAYDTDDRVYRVTTMVQMVGVVILALGLPRLFTSIEHGGHVDNVVMVAGYIVMRVAMLLQWLRAARQCPDDRRACLTYAATLVIAQVGWVVTAVADMSLAAFFAAAVPLFLIELSGPFIAERLMGGTPWRAHHIAERYGLLAIITLGEGVIGTVASTGAVTADGWDADVAFVAAAGIGLTFGMWWIYFVLPSGEVLHQHRERSFGRGYGHMLLFAAIAAVGAGLHVAGYVVEHDAAVPEADFVHLGTLGAVVSIALPVGGFVLLVYALYSYLLRSAERFHVLLLMLTALAIAGAVWLAAAGASLSLCLVVLTLAPFVTVVGYEAHGHRHQAQSLAHL
ncbi:low temperature requirement protein A [Luteipulveratus halotolerans]|uniref:Membrane protein n=1 Tax=Luteipulveratus halotolerans TaxID=1631356 RepID=A0A0L6CIL6_9MICO|nr:low temperature requirement protein A [Luteipulveratus halotolerans]KNX37569.1 membrane protein [Luteipulveratus halotolerans]